MDEQMKLLWSNIKEEMEKQNQKQTQAIAETISKTLEEHLAPIRQENEVLRREVDTLRSRIRSLEMESRKNNIILHGVEETEAGKEDLINKVLELLNKTSEPRSENHSWDKWEINQLHRIGKKSDNKTRPIKISCTLSWRRNEIMKNKKRLPEGIYITEDLSKEEVEIRKALIPKLKEARESGKYAIIKNGKLVIREKTDAEKRKRATSSPPSTPPNYFSKPQENINPSQPAKISKINPFEAMRNRTTANETQKN
uniref:Endonuclease-reverse transcriptase n=1 Tax=Pectinophora gossypiella TaxID=13191 RepID=A0A1E1WPR1_PECGO